MRSTTCAFSKIVIRCDFNLFLFFTLQKSTHGKRVMMNERKKKKKKKQKENNNVNSKQVQVKTKTMKRMKSFKYVFVFASKSIDENPFWMKTKLKRVKKVKENAD